MQDFYGLVQEPILAKWNKNDINMENKKVSHVCMTNEPTLPSNVSQRLKQNTNKQENVHTFTCHFGGLR